MKSVFVLIDHPNLDYMLVPVIEELSHTGRINVITCVRDDGSVELLSSKNIPYVTDFKYFKEFLINPGEKLFLNAADQNHPPHIIGKKMDQMCGQLGVPSLTIGHIPYSMYSDNLSDKSLFNADRIALYGQNDYEVHRNKGVPVERLVITGCPKYDIYDLANHKTDHKQNRCRTIPESGRKYILFAGINQRFTVMGKYSDEQWSQVLGDSFRSLIRNFPDLDIVIKPHPAEHYHNTIRLYEDAIEPGLEARIKFVNAHASLSQVLTDAELVLTFSPSIVHETLLLEIPVIYFAGTGTPSTAIMECRKNGALILQTNWLKIPQALNKAARDIHLPSLKICLDDEFIDKHYYKRDGQASSRIAFLIEEMMGKKPVHLKNGHLQECKYKFSVKPSIGPRASIIIPVFNQLSFTRKCLQALKINTPDELYEVIVVDNASSDGTPEYLGKLNRELKVLANTENLGFAGACNQGAAAAAGKYLVFLNNDTIPQSGWLEALISLAESNSEIGIVGSKLLYPNGSIQHAGIELINGIPDHPFRNAPGDLPEVCELKEFDMLTGACLLISKDLFNACGLFDEAYRNGVEDIDLCLKVRSRGFKVVYNPNSVLYHYEGKTPGRFKHVNDNLSLFRSRWGSHFDENGNFIRPRQNIPTHRGKTVQKIGAAHSAGAARGESEMTYALPCPDSTSHSGGVARRKGDLEPLRVVWEGSQFVYHSLALVNRELCIGLADHSDVELSLIPYEHHQFDAAADPDRLQLIADRMYRPLSKPAEFHVRHLWPPNFEPPSEGHWIMIQPWEYGALPEEWIEPLQSKVDEIWAYTRYVRNVYISSGIPGAKVHVIPLGVDYGQFHPRAPLLSLDTKKQFKFLFVGGTIGRKGIDVLLGAYAEAFSSADDVCLVIKDMGAESFYKGQDAARLIESLKKDPASPEIVFLSETLNQDQIAGLYAACDCLVHPYRGEGFGLPVAEAMACGLPVIVTRGGACDDFCSEEFVFFIDGKRRPTHISGHKLVSPGWVLEPDKRQLIERLKYVYENPDQAHRKGKLAAKKIRNSLGWQKSVDLIIERLKKLRNKPICRFGQIRADPQKYQAGGIVLKSTEEMYQDIQPLVENEWYEAAISALGKLLESYPEFPPALSDLGALYYKIGDKEKALTHNERAVQLDPANFVFKKNLANFYYVEQGRVEDALKLYTDVLAMNPRDIETLLIAGHICVSLKQFEDAGVFYQRVLEIEPGNADAGQYLEKLADIGQRETEPKTPEEIYQQIQPLMEGNDPQIVIEALEKLISTHPDFALAHNDLGVLNYSAGNKEKALGHYERAAHLQPGNITFKKNLADFYYVEQNRVEDALKLYVDALTMNPEDVETLLITGHICVSLHQLDDAIEFYQRVLQIEPGNTDAGQCLEKLQNIGQTEPEPKTPAEMYGQIQPLREANDSQAVIDELEKLLGIYPDFALAHNDLGVLYYHAYQKENALGHYERAVQLESGNITFKKNLADFYYVEQGRVEDALKLYVDVLTINPQDVQTLLMAGHICVGLHQLDDARVFYNRVVEIEPWNTDARRNLDSLELKRKAG